MKLLVVEDTEKLATLICGGLTDEGFVVDHVADGAKALARISLYHDDYDVILLDLGLPSMQGDAIVTQVRAKNIHTPILVLTARDTLSDKVDLLSLGADDYLTKPFQFDELVARIRALGRRPRAQQSTTTLHKSLILDRAAHNASITLHGSTVPLDISHKEFLILSYLLDHKDKTVTRDELFSHAWDFNNAARSNTVDAHIKNIRAKIKKHTHEEYITTLRGVGYRLAA